MQSLGAAAHGSSAPQAFLMGMLLWTAIHWWAASVIVIVISVRKIIITARRWLTLLSSWSWLMETSRRNRPSTTIPSIFLWTPWRRSRPLTSSTSRMLGTRSEVSLPIVLTILYGTHRDGHHDKMHHPVLPVHRRYCVRVHAD